MKTHAWIWFGLALLFFVATVVLWAVTKDDSEVLTGLGFTIAAGAGLTATWTDQKVAELEARVAALEASKDAAKAPKPLAPTDVAIAATLLLWKRSRDRD